MKPKMSLEFPLLTQAANHSRKLILFFCFAFACLAPHLNAQVFDPDLNQDNQEIRNKRDECLQDVKDDSQAIENLENVIEILETLEDLPFMDGAFDDSIEIIEESIEWLEERIEINTDNAEEYNSILPQDWV